MQYSSHPRLPYHRIPRDVAAPWRLRPGQHVLDLTQTVHETQEVGVYLTVYIALVDPEGGNCRRTQVYQSKGSLN